MTRLIFFSENIVFQGVQIYDIFGHTAGTWVINASASATLAHRLGHWSTCKSTHQAEWRQHQQASVPKATSPPRPAKRKTVKTTPIQWLNPCSSISHCWLTFSQPTLLQLHTLPRISLSMRPDSSKTSALYKWFTYLLTYLLIYVRHAACYSKMSHIGALVAS